MTRIPTLIRPIEVYQGETWSVTVTLSGDSAPANLEGYNIFMDWRKAQGADAIQRFSLDLGNVTVDPVLPRAAFFLTGAETKELPIGTYPLDCFFETPTNGFVVTFAGSVAVLPRVTRTEDA